MESFQKIITVGEEDLDELQRVNNVRYVQWVQDVAKAHWQKAVPQALQEEVVWVLIKHTIVYKNPAKIGDQILAKTYVKRSEGATSTRVVELFHKNTLNPVVHSTTTWVLLNKKTFKPTRISEAIKVIFHPETPKTL